MKRLYPILQFAIYILSRLAFIVMVILCVLGLLFQLAALATATEVYTLRRVKRIDADLYRGGNIYFKTRYCYHYTNSEDVILEWDGRRGKVVWDDDTTCQVVDVFKKAAY